MAFYNEKERLYLEIDASGVGLRASPLQPEGNGLPKGWGTQQHGTVANGIHK